MSVLAQRLTYGTLLLGGAIALLAFDHWRSGSLGLLVLLLVLLGLGWIEWARLVALPGRARRLGLLVLLGGVGAYGWLQARPDTGEMLGLLSISFPLALPGMLAIDALRRAPTWPELHRIALAALGVVYLGLPALCCLRIRGLEQGEVWILLLLVVVKGNDIGAYLVGRKWGRTPLSKISPKKTREGSLGGLLLGVGIAVTVSWFADLPGGAVGGVLVGVVAGLAGQVGDLAESMVKRSVGAKDSGSLIPAFGGALDLLDSVLFGAPAVLLAAWILTRVG